jgi:hypothetical protein
MRLVAGGANGLYLREILDNADRHEVTRVDAAVAYASDERLLFDWCWERRERVSLRFWGRFDEGLPVAAPILRKFLNRQSPRYVCKLVRMFHPKVIWWRGYGAYIGSANLTDAAWHNNFEAGLFLTDDELEAAGIATDLDHLFEKIDEHASPLTEELVKRVERRAVELGQRAQAQNEADNDFLDTDLVQRFEGLVRVTSKTAKARQRDAFLKEWISTLEILRSIASKVSKPENRPDWVSPDSPAGAQADQFLHAHYYQRTFDGQTAAYERHFEETMRDPEAALNASIAWWKGLPEGGDEQKTLNIVAPKLKVALSREGVDQMTEDGFAEVLWNVHASREYARRAANARLGLPEGQVLDNPTKSRALAGRVWNASSPPGEKVKSTLDFILYGGSPDEVPQRLWEALHDPKRRIEMLGISSLGEIVGWAMPDRYPPRNGRTSKALRSLGFDVKVHVG